MSFIALSIATTMLLIERVTCLILAAVSTLEATASTLEDKRR